MGKPPRPRPTPTTSAKNNGPNISNVVPAVAAKFSSNSSTGSGSTANAPSSVMCVPASPLTRDLSDLSGSYMNGNTNPRRMLHHSNSNFSTDGSSHHPPGFWHQAHILSSPCPAVREPQNVSSSPSRPKAPAEAPALIVVERNGVIELVKKSLTDDDDNNEMDKNNITGEGDEHSIVRQSSESKESDLLSSMEENIMFLAHATPPASINSVDQQQHQQQHDSLLADENSARIPILILLLDPGRKQYEIMQLWVDLQTDLVRDVLHTLQRKLSDKWRQDYDGLFQMRGSNYCQLLHILDIAKYDVRPRELLVAKPWSMAARAASEHATDCIKQLRAGGLLSVYSDTPSSSKSLMKNFLRNKGSASSGSNSPTFQEEKPLTLSEDAIKRLYLPDRMFLNHHHAHQFLSFRAPSPLPQVVGTRTPQQQNRFFGSLLGTSTSFDDDSSQLSNPLFGTDPQNEKCNSSSSTLGSTPSPSRRRRQQHQRGYAPRFSSHFGPTLPAVGEGTATNAKETGGKNNTHYILADLEGNAGEDLGEQLVEAADKKKKGSRLKKMLAPLNCASCRRSSASKIGNDGYLSGSSSQHGNNNHSKGDDSQNGRDTPTSKGSDDAWEGAKCQEDGSIISESAPLLASMLASSSCSNLQHPLAGQQYIPQPGPKQQELARPAPFSRMGKF